MLWWVLFLFRYSKTTSLSLRRLSESDWPVWRNFQPQPNPVSPFLMSLISDVTHFWCHSFLISFISDVINFWYHSFLMSLISDVTLFWYHSFLMSLISDVTHFCCSSFLISLIFDVIQFYCYCFLISDVINLYSHLFLMSLNAKYNVEKKRILNS